MLALLNTPMRGFVSPEQYARLSDWSIIHCYLAARGDDGALVPMRRRGRASEDGPTGDPEAAGAELPSVADLEVPPDALRYGLPMDFVLMSFQWYRNQGLDAEARAAKWRARMEREGRTAG